MSCPKRGKNKKNFKKFYSAKVKILFKSKWIGIKCEMILNISTYKMCEIFCNNCVLKL
jgi:hypothetical protein